MASHRDRCDAFRALHHTDTPLVMPNPWDIGSDRLLETIGFEALATTSSGFAHSLGRLDGEISPAELMRHVADIVAAIDIPLGVDFENGFASGIADMTANITALGTTGAAGVSLEDFTGSLDDPIYDVGFATERIAAAAEVTQIGDARMVLTGRAENYLYGRTDLADTIARLQSYAEAGADVVYAPGLTSLDDIRRVVESVPVPVNVLAVRGAPSVEELAAVGVARISVGGAFSLVAAGALARAARELLHDGTYGYWAGAIDNDDKLAAWG